MSLTGWKADRCFRPSGLRARVVRVVIGMKEMGNTWADGSKPES